MRTTKEEVLMMEPGLDLDVAVARAMGLRLDYEFAELHGGRPCVPALRDQHDEWGVLPRYSEDIADAWPVIERFHFTIVPAGGGGMPAGYWVGFVQVDAETGRTLHEVLDVSNPSSAFGLTAPLAIARAALLARIER